MQPADPQCVSIRNNYRSRKHEGTHDGDLMKISPQLTSCFVFSLRKNESLSKKYSYWISLISYYYLLMFVALVIHGVVCQSN